MKAGWCKLCRHKRVWFLFFLPLASCLTLIISVSSAQEERSVQLRALDGSAVVTGKLIEVIDGSTASAVVLLAVATGVFLPWIFRLLMGGSGEESPDH